MILQNFALPINDEVKKEVWYRAIGISKQNGNQLILDPGSSISSDTYMNMFDIKTWKRYTTIKDIMFLFSVKGNGKIFVYVKTENQENILIQERSFNCLIEKDEILIELPLVKISEYNEGFIYFVIEAFEKCIVNNCRIECNEIVTNRIHLSIGICTYQRLPSLLCILKTLQEYIESIEDEWIDIVVVDNDSTIAEPFSDFIKCIHNKNSGGSGGFTKAMETIQKNHSEKQTSHVLLMDDDVILQIESIIRLKALLTFIKEEKKGEVVAGRMFCLDRMHIQHTAVEKWNSGKPIHFGYNMDMSIKENIMYINENNGAEYSGWWFACFPINFILQNKPLPFFLHGDDAEYGLRHGGEPIILNGIQVWHETYQYRKSAVISYYDVRNSLFVCQLHSKKRAVIILFLKCILRSIKFIFSGHIITAKMQLLGVRDYIKGIEWLQSLDTEEYHKQIRNCSLSIINNKRLKRK